MPLRGVERWRCHGSNQANFFVTLGRPFWVENQRWQLDGNRLKEFINKMEENNFKDLLQDRVPHPACITFSYVFSEIFYTFLVVGTMDPTPWESLPSNFGIVAVIAGEDNGTPLQYSCLENPMDRGAWWATVHGVAKSRTWLSDFTFTFHFHALDKEMATHSSVLAWRIPGMGEPGGLLCMGSHRVRHDWSDLAAAAAAAVIARLWKERLSL